MNCKPDMTDTATDIGPVHTAGEKMTNGSAQNTDVELWREREGDYYADSIHVTEHGGIGINCGGHVIVKTLRAWHDLDARNRFLAEALTKVIEDVKEAMRKSTSEILELENRRMLTRGVDSTPNT